MPKSCISMGNTKVFTMSRFFKTFLARQGEPAILALIENWERSVGFKAEKKESVKKVEVKAAK